MKNLIKEILISYHKECSVDRYGQVDTLRLYSVFGERQQEVLEYVEGDDSLISVSTYGGRLGTYKGIQIVDVDLRKRCSEALRSNPNYKEAMTTL